MAARTGQAPLKDQAKPYQWVKLNIFARWLPAGTRVVVLVFDADPHMADRIPRLLLGELDEGELADLFWIYPRLLQEVVRLQDEAVWAIRDQVRAAENNRDTSSRPRPDYRHLHELARHAIHVFETLDVAVATASSILHQHDRLMTDAAYKLRYVSVRVHDRLLFFQQILYSLRSRSASNKERLLNEIGLAFNTVAQHDSGISVQIGRAAKADSEAMKTISFVALAFLPATFICAVFSMSFFTFNGDSGEWMISDRFWIYWVIAVPVTLLTSMVWHYWQQIFSLELVGEAEEHTTRVKTGLAKLFSNVRDIERAEIS
ncbi:hypothetical protein GE09DRAFT_690473 [Coniochaeta sp. 2T2.1]|nr:hypothetical protein GE09DRAFT_690473 [Coniochaeta sp. 2T2.1]